MCQWRICLHLAAMSIKLSKNRFGWLRGESSRAPAPAREKFSKLESQVMRRNDSPHENWKVNARFRINGQVSAAWLTASSRKMY
jgi:hypothetical protein